MPPGVCFCVWSTCICRLPSTWIWHEYDYFLNTHIKIYTFPYACVCVCVYACLYVCVPVCVCVCVFCVYIPVSMHVHWPCACIRAVHASGQFIVERGQKWRSLPPNRCEFVITHLFLCSQPSFPHISIQIFFSLVRRPSSMLRSLLFTVILSSYSYSNSHLPALQSCTFFSLIYSLKSNSVKQCRCNTLSHYVVFSVLLLSFLTFPRSVGRNRPQLERWFASSGTFNSLYLFPLHRGQIWEGWVG